jgi:segregation and condensation protein B
LAIVAYRQPITRPEIESIRGVNSDSVLRTLLSTGLIEDVGRAPTVGRPILYGTTFEFLQHFGLSGLDELPPLDAPASGEQEKEA